VRLWDLSSGKEVLAARPTHTAGVIEAAFSADGRMLASASAGPIRLSLDSSAEGEVLFWDSRSGCPLGRCEAAPGAPGRLTFTPEGTLLAGVIARHTPRLVEMNPRTAKVLRTMPEQDLLVLSADGRYLLCKERRGDEEIAVVRERSTGKEVCRHGRKGNVRHAGILPDGERFVTVFALADVPGDPPSTLGEIHSLATGRRVARWTRKLVSASVQSSADGRLLAEFPSVGEVEVFELETGRTVFSKRAKGGIHFGVLSPDGAFLALGQDDRIQLWELATVQQMHVFGSGATYSSSATPLAFSPEGRRLASGGNSAEVLVWDVFDPDRSSMPLTEDALKRCWQDLARSGGPAAYQAMRMLLGRPEQAVEFLSNRLTPVPAIEPAVLRRWLAQLGSDSFPVRQEASQHLQEAGDVVVPDLHRALAANPEPETARRIRAVLAAIHPVHASGDRLRLLRGIQVLERLGSLAARDVLSTLTHGAPSARPTRAARESLARMPPAK
jgi:hypothetical protein